jgi:hypothetical protein
MAIPRKLQECGFGDSPPFAGRLPPEEWILPAMAHVPVPHKSHPTAAGYGTRRINPCHESEVTDPEHRMVLQPQRSHRQVIYHCVPPDSGIDGNAEIAT